MENNRDYKKLFNEINYGIIIQDYTGLIVDANTYASNIFTSSPEGLIGLTNGFYTEIAFRENGMEFLDDFPTDIVLKEQSAPQSKTALIKGTGGSIWIEVISTPKFDENNTLTTIVTTITDVSQKVKMARKTIELENFYQNILDQIPLVIFWKDKDLIYRGGNQAFCNAAGVLSAEELAGKTDYELAWPDQARTFREYDRKIIDKGEAIYHIIEPQKQASGNTVWLDTNKIPLFTNTGEPAGILGTFEDITQRLQKEKKAESIQELSTEAINSIPSAIIGLNKDLAITFWNKAATEFTSITAKKALNRNIAAIPPLADLSSAVKQVLKDGAKFTDSSFRLQQGELEKNLILSIFITHNKNIIIQLDNK